ncbi:hypothetical protein ACRE_067530 [Hapsidospora chrysogenum ATCC 11550]|uniref:3CxxC-type domain-containing protein n=1 Tax=Hapsidospora chrysogenum (strain ATCC 11550 / CBS 779.69 / DSM 880 / IAM 14645 / JCM 23072 / IMI 49137) TaxID=857340 RepID=A0A086SZK0_HAPC1|nr:hypothetical protein ACRE_067530 [Hapsidospora chrysogenum ATCC 11550]
MSTETRFSFMFPSLHDEIVDAVTEDMGEPWFNHDEDDVHADNEYATHVMGRFTCDNPTCSKGSWGSKKVAILIQRYRNNGYNAIVFNQRCGSCNALGTFEIDEKSYIERVAYRLKKWAGVRMERQPYSTKKGLPHRRELCEGCRLGYCQEG